MRIVDPGSGVQGWVLGRRECRWLLHEWFVSYLSSYSTWAWTARYLLVRRGFFCKPFVFVFFFLFFPRFYVCAPTPSPEEHEVDVSRSMLRETCVGVVGGGSFGGRKTLSTILIVSISSLLGLASLLKNPPGNLPAAANFSL